MYYKKYLKYKQKYSDLKKNFINQVGGNRKILFTFNNDYVRVYVYDIQAPDDDFDTFKKRILHNPDDKNLEILDKSITISTNEYFSALPSFTILNICTRSENIKQDILKCMIFDMSEPDLDGEATPFRRTKSYEPVESLFLIQQQKPLNLFLYDVKYSQIKFYKNNRLIGCNYPNTDLPIQNNYTDIIVLFDSGNGAKTLIPKSIAQKLQCNIISTRPKADFIQFCNAIGIFFTILNQTALFQFLLASGPLDSRTIYDRSKIFLDLLKGRNLNKIYYEFINKLNLEISSGVNSEGVTGFETTNFQFLINGTENNFKNRVGIDIPLSVNAIITDDLDFILINDKTIETLEYYKLFIFVSDKHLDYNDKNKEIEKQPARSDAISRRLSEEKEGDKAQFEKIKYIITENKNFEIEKSQVERMNCTNHFYKINIKKTQILLQDRKNQYMEPVGNYRVTFDTGNFANTLISPAFIRKNPNINFNPVSVMPLPMFYEFLNNLITKYHDNVQLRQVLSRWINKKITSAQIYAEFMGSTSEEFQESYKSIFINYLGLSSSGDVHNTFVVKGGTRYTIRLGIQNFPYNIEINAISTDRIMPIDLSTGNPATLSPPSSFDILISVNDTKKLNDRLCFIGNVQQKDVVDSVVLDLRNKIIELLAFLAQSQNVLTEEEIAEINEQIEAFERDIDVYGKQKYAAEMMECINDQFFIKKFYEDIILIAHKKFEFIFKKFNENFRDIYEKFNTDYKYSFKELRERYKEQEKIVNNFIEYIYKRPSFDINKITIVDLQKIFTHIHSKKCRFLTALQNLVNTANEIRVKVSPSSSAYIINDKYNK